MLWLTFQPINADMVSYITNENPNERQYKKVEDFENLVSKLIPEKFQIVKQAIEHMQVGFVNFETKEIHIKDIVSTFSNDCDFETLKNLNIVEEEEKAITKQQRIVQDSKNLMDKVFTWRKNESDYFRYRG